MWGSLVLAAALIGQAQDPAARSRAGDAAATASLRGVVVRAESGTPLGRVTLILSASGGGAWEAATDADGTFEFIGLPAGRFTLAARRPGYESRGSLPLTLKAGERADRVTIPLRRGGAIEGRLVDEDGEPLAEVYVRALRAEYIAGGRRFRAQHGVQTNDLGHYRLYGLPPGRYFVTAAIRSADLATYNPEKPVDSMRGGTGFAPTFFPGTALAAEAQPVIVRAGEDALGVDFTLRAVRLARISGTIVDSRGRPAPQNLVMLNAARTGGAVVTGSVLDMGLVEPRADGSFVLSNVKPGEYRLDVHSKARIEAIAQTGGVGLPQGGGAPEYASVPLTISGEDIEGLRIATIAGHRMSGRIVVHGAASTPEILQSMKVTLGDLSAGPGMSAAMLVAGAPVQPDGTFDVRGVSGTRSVSVHGLPSGWALKSVRLSGLDATDRGIDVRGGDVTDVEITVTATPAQISGTVLDGAGRPVADARVIIFPEDRALWAGPPNRHLASAVVGPGGAFTVSPLPAGAYLVAIVDELVDGEWAEPAHLEGLREAAARVKLNEAESKTLTLRR